MPQYTPAYYARYADGAQCSAAVVVPLVLGLARPRSVVDVGCGMGAWLAAFQRHGYHAIDCLRPVLWHVGTKAPGDGRQRTRAGVTRDLISAPFTDADAGARGQPPWSLSPDDRTPWER